MSYSGYGAVGLIGGGDGALDKIDGATLIDGDVAFVPAYGSYRSHFFIMDADNAGAEDSPLIISPDTNPGNKRWVLTKLATRDIDLYEDASTKKAQIYLSSSQLFIDNTVTSKEVYMRSKNAGASMTTLLYGDPDGVVALYHNGTQRFETQTEGNGILVKSDAARTSAHMGVNGIYTYYDDANAYTMRIYVNSSGDGLIQMQTGLGKSISLKARNTGDTDYNFLFTGDPDGAASLYYGGTVKISTATDGVHYEGTRDFDINTGSGYATFTANAGGWNMYYGFIGSGSTNLGGVGAYGDTDTCTYFWIGKSYTDTCLTAAPDGAVTLFYNDAVKAATASDGTVITGHIYPAADNTYDVGKSGSRWDDVYATNGTIQTSDLRDKENIKASLGLDFINRLNPVTYNWINKTRPHQGFIAQEIETVLKDLDIDFAGFIYSKEDDRYNLRYNEFIAPLCRAVQELSAEVKMLKERK